MRVTLAYKKLNSFHPLSLAVSWSTSDGPTGLPPPPLWRAKPTTTRAQTSPLSLEMPTFVIVAALPAWSLQSGTSHPQRHKDVGFGISGGSGQQRFLLSQQQSLVRAGANVWGQCPSLDLDNDVPHKTLPQMRPCPYCLLTWPCWRPWLVGSAVG